MQTVVSKTVTSVTPDTLISHRDGSLMDSIFVGGKKRGRKAICVPTVSNEKKRKKSSTALVAVMINKKNTFLFFGCCSPRKLLSSAHETTN